MKRLKEVHLVQFSFFEANTIETYGNLAILGANGAGKSSFLDAVQIVMLGANKRYLAFNAQSVSATNRRTIRDYCLGAMRSEQSQNKSLMRKRDYATSYITLVFEDEKDGSHISAGVCIYASANDSDHRLLGLYLLPGVRLALDDHLSKESGGDIPVDWDVFDVAIRRLAKDQGRTPCITVHPDEYVDELLHALQPKARHMDKRAYSRAMRKSLQLKDIESVSDFMRDHLIDARTIDKQAAKQCIQKLTELNDLIENVTNQIVQLKDIEKQYEKMETQLIRRDTFKATRLQILLESKDSEMGQILRQLEENTQRLNALEKSVPQKNEELIATRKRLAELIAAIAADPESTRSDQARALSLQYSMTVRERHKAIDSLCLKLRDALSNATNALEEIDNESFEDFNELTVLWERKAKAAELPDLVQVKEVLDRLRIIKVQLEEAVAPVRGKLHENEKKRVAITERIAAAQKGIKLSSQDAQDDTAVAMSVLRDKGISCAPVGSLVNVKDDKWQGAIETFLSRHRLALVVQEGKEQDAVREIRYSKYDVYDVTVVQPKHLERDLNREYSDNSVASLLEGEDPVALAYLRRILGSMKKVETERDLEDNDRALTKDGMLSANGGTKRLRLIDSKKWLLGASVNIEDTRQLIFEHDELTQTIRALQSQVKAVDKARDDIAVALAEASESAFHAALQALRSSEEKLSTLPDPENVPLPEHLAQLNREKKHKEELEIAFDKELIEMRANLVSVGEAVKTLRNNHERSERELKELENQYKEACAMPNYDSQLAVETYTKALLKSEQEGHAVMLVWLNKESDEAFRKFEDAKVPAKIAFLRYIDDHSIGLTDERSDWRSAFNWVSSRILDLEGSTLANYKDQAEEAKRTATETFRTDVALRIREAIRSLRKDIDELNKILEACPAFSGNERYEFVATPSSAYKDIYDLVMNSADWTGSNGSFFSDENGAHKLVIEWLEASANEQAKKDNPLEDYRLLFTFDLKILKDGQVVDYLSKRVGVGSNGEHRVPFYVIAGAALASSYKIKAGADHDGAAIMLLDEAFYGMDAQNTLAAAEALTKLGLQLIMAAPDADRGKLIPVCDTIFDMIRFGADAFGDVTHIKEPAKEIMTSDMLMLHPELLDAKVAELKEEV